MRLKLIRSGMAAITLLLAGSLSAQAADIPRPVYKGIRSVVDYNNWTGFYLGVSGGYAWGDASWDLFLHSSKPDGWLVGLTLGYNYQVGSWVWGIEGDYAWADIRSSDTCLLVFTCQTKNTNLATIRGRVGYSFDRWMPYFTGGGAYGNVKVSEALTGLNASKDQFGWTVGGGIEYAFLGNWTGKLEYLYVDLGSYNTGLIAPLTDNVRFDGHVVRAGLNYKFSGPIFSRW